MTQASKNDRQGDVSKPKLTDDQVKSLARVAAIADPLVRLADRVDHLLFWAEVRSDFKHAVRILGRIWVLGKWLLGISFVVILYLIASLGIRDFTVLVEQLQQYTGRQ